MDAGDVNRLITWQEHNGIGLDMVFNAGGITETYPPRSPPTDRPFCWRTRMSSSGSTTHGATSSSAASRCARRRAAGTAPPRRTEVAGTATYEDGTLIPRVDDSVPADTAADGGLGYYWATTASIQAQIQDNLDWAATNSLPNFDPDELVTGEHSGLKMLPTEQQPIDNPLLGPALDATGILYTASDASRDPNSRTVDNSSTKTVPRHPMNIFFNAGKFIDQVDEYNWIYTSAEDGGSGDCTTNPNSTCITPLAAANNTQAETSFNSYIVPLEVRKALSFVLTNDPRPFYAHQSNLAEDGILYPVLNELLGVYNSTYDKTATPLVQTGLTGQYQALNRLSDWQSDSASVEAYVDATGVHIPASSARVPVTVPAGSTVRPWTPTRAHCPAGWTRRPLRPPSRSRPPPAGTCRRLRSDAPTALVGTAGDTEVALTWTAPANDGGSPILGYTVQPYEGPAETETPLAPLDSPGAGTAFTVPGLTNGTEYRFEVTAYNALGDGPTSTKSASFIPFGKPDAPTAVTAVATATDPTLAPDEVRVSWTPPADNGRAITELRDPEGG